MVLRDAIKIDVTCQTIVLYQTMYTYVHRFGLVAAIHVAAAGV